MESEHLVELERNGWRALSSGTGAEFYDATLAPDAAMALPIGLLDRNACIDAMAAAPPWNTYELSDFRVLGLSEASAVVMYRATAQREGQPSYSALMSTVYTENDGRWLISLHQQTPLTDE